MPYSASHDKSQLSNPASSIEAVQALAHLRGLAKTRTLTLLTASKAADISEATVLAGLLQ
jgi:hypothetical protein